MKNPIINAKERKLFGRKVKQLRKEGIVPGNIYGKKVKSKAIEVIGKEFEKIFRQFGVTGLVDLKLGGKTIPVLITNVQIHPVTDNVLHADFHQVDLKVKVTASVPLEIIGDAPAVTEKKGVLLTILSEVEVEALPSDLPEKVTVDISSLKEIDDMINVSQLKVSKGITLITESDRDVVKIAPLVSKQAEEMVKEEEAKEEELAAEEAKEEESADTEGKPVQEDEGKSSEADDKQPKEEK